MVVLGQCVLGSLSPRAQMGFLNRNCGNRQVLTCCAYWLGKTAQVTVGAGLVS